MPTVETLVALVRQIEAKKVKYKGQLQPPASASGLETVARKAQELYGYSLPDAYLKLISVSDGINFNGYTIYASRTNPISGHADRFIEGFVEANDLWEDYEENADHHLLMFGETGDDLYLFDRRDNKFKVTDKVGGDAYEEFDTFEELAELLLKSALGIFNDN